MTLVGVDVEGIATVQRLLSQIDNPQVARAVTKDIAKHLQGKMKKYPNYTYVSRARAYGRTFQSAKQRRWFFAALHRGDLVIPYQRTDTLSRGWKIETFGATDHIVVNEVPYARFVQNSPQARMMTYRQWRSIQRVIHDDRYAINRQAQEAFSRAMKKIRG